MRRVTDEALALRAAKGDDVAFAELARRYRPLIRAAARRVPEGQDVDDARQAALIGLFDACRATDGVRRFAGIAGVCVPRRVGVACRDAARKKQRVLTAATREGDGPLEWVPAREGADPARVVELRDELRERLRQEPDALRRAFAPPPDSGRRYSQARIARALELIADGATIRAAADAVGVEYHTARLWATRAPADSPAGSAIAARRARAPHGNLARHFSDEQRHRAVSLVAEGGSLRAAAAAVGATSPTVLRWLRQAA